MKTLLLISSIFYSLFSTFLIAQSDEYPKHIVMSATENGIDISSMAMEQTQYITFYKVEGDEQLYMVNYMQKSQSQSYGPIFAFDYTKNEETEDSYEYEVFKFNWRYYNTYDSETGVAQVKLIKIYKPQGTTFKIELVTEKLDLIIYKGYIEGTVNFSEFD